MVEFPLHTMESAPGESRAVMAAARERYGVLPNLHRALAESPSALAGFEMLRETFRASSLSPVEQEVVYLTVAHANRCHYCTAQSGTFDAGADAAEAAEAIREHRVIRDARLQALRRFTAAVVRERGWVSQETTADFLGAGFTRENLLDVMCGVALGTMAGYTSHIAATPVDPPPGAGTRLDS